MDVTFQAALLCVILLCALGETVPLLLGRCAGTWCLVIRDERLDFAGAQRRCEDTGGVLLPDTVALGEAMETLLAALGSSGTGSFWLAQQSGGTSEETLQKCAVVSRIGSNTLAVVLEDCHSNTNGSVCQYTFQEPCAIPKSGAQVGYTSHFGFKVVDSELFPPGTVASMGNAGDGFPDSKYLCASGLWMRAPWSCEVLQGGCEYSCDQRRASCVCPAGRSLHPNNVTCAIDACGGCAHECRRLTESGFYACVCPRGYKLAQDGRSCVDVDECAEGGQRCAREGEECWNTVGGYECRCRDGFDEEDGECVDVAVCQKCEHMLCEKSSGVYACACHQGFRVSTSDPTKCVRHCTGRDCTAECIYDPEVTQIDMQHCRCPDGYIKDIKDNAIICTDLNECEMGLCDQDCENLFGGYRCLCDEGFDLHMDGRCEPAKDEKDDEKEAEGDDGSGSPSLAPTRATAQPVTLPSYVKTGSVLGITVFMALFAVLLCLVVRNASRRCGRFDLPSFRHPDIDVFYLQQVSTETYKRLSFDKQSRNDAQRP